MTGDGRFPFETVIHALWHHADASPDRLALTEGSSELTYGQLCDAIEARAGWLVGEGVGRQEVVVVVGDNRLTWVISFLAAMRIGAVAVPLNNRLAASQVAELMTFLGASLVLSDGAHLELFDGCPDLRIVNTEALEHVAVSDLPPMPRPEEIALLSFTSGTTGIPKGAVISHDALVTAAAVFQNIIDGDAEASTLIVAPLFHNTGFVDQLSTLIICGGRIDLLRRFRTADAVEQFQRRPTTYVTAVPSVIRMMMMADGADAIFGHARDVIYGGSPMPGAWIEELLERWPHLRLWHGYGLTEFTSCCSYLPYELVRDHGESIGYAAPDVELRLVGEDGRDVGDNEPGEIWVAGRTRMLEYWRRPGQTAEKISGKWLRTGDLAERREQGLLYHVGRRDDVINRGGEKILPSFVEGVLSRVPGVAQTCVFGVPNPILQNSIIAAIEPRDGMEIDRGAMRAALEAGLPGYAIPEDIFVRNDLPRTGSGKLDRKAIRSLYLETTKTSA